RPAALSTPLPALHDALPICLAQPWVGGDDLAAEQPFLPATEVRHQRSRLPRDERPRGHVPGRKVQLPVPVEASLGDVAEVESGGDRKSTRLNSSHVKSSYAV